jgi:hypothetical protein
MNMHVPALKRSLQDVVAEYDLKRAGIDEAMAAHKRACNDLKSSAAVGGTFGAYVLHSLADNVHRSDMEKALLKSAWLHVYEGLSINVVASARDRKLFEQSMEKPAPFTLENIGATFGRYILDPRGNILRGLAETFCSLDQSYKSHEKMKIGVAGLPKRIVLSNVGSYGSRGREELKDVLNALASYRGEPLIENVDLRPIDDLHSSIRATSGQVVIPDKLDEDGKVIRRGGLTIKKFLNGNAHLMFNQAALRDINKALSDYYGEVLPDCPEERPAKQASTEVSKDLQFYPTPSSVVALTLRKIAHKFGDDFLKGKKLLEPSCGDGRFMVAAHAKGASPFGFEVDINRTLECRKRGLRVLCANFLETEPCGTYDVALMNPPFYGKHYAKHVRHAYKFLKPGGRLIAILPATARDHGLLDDVGVRSRYMDAPWDDLPVGSFSESGTNINTVLFIVTKES